MPAKQYYDTRLILATLRELLAAKRDTPPASVAKEMENPASSPLRAAGAKGYVEGYRHGFQAAIAALDDILTRAK